MKLNKLTDRIYYSDYDELRDRPILGYIKGDNFSVAIDAGHSRKHVQEFYDLLKENNLPLPSYTIITHWHWDHCFGMHAVNGKTIASNKTNDYLKEFISNRSIENDNMFLHLDPSIEKEYENNEPIIVKEADITFDDKYIIKDNNLTIEAFKVISPHTDDSVLIYIKEEKVLFIGDGTSGVFPSWIADKGLSKQLHDILKTIDFNYCIGGHWPIENKESALIRALNE